MTHSLTFKVATLTDATDGEPRVQTFDIPAYVKLASKPKQSGTMYKAYHFHKSEKTRLNKAANAAKAAGDKELAQQLKDQENHFADSLSATKDDKAIMPFIFKDDVTFKMGKWPDGSPRKQRDNKQIEAFSLIMLDIESKITKEEIHEALKDYEYVLWPTVTHKPEDPRFRVTLFPRAPMSIEDAQALILRVDAHLPANNELTSQTQAIDFASLGIGRLMYLPLWLAGHPEKYFYVHNEGALVDTDSFALDGEALDAMLKRQQAMQTASKVRQQEATKIALANTSDDAVLIERNGKVWLNPKGQLETTKGWVTVEDIRGKISGVSCPAHGDTNGSEFVTLNSYSGRPQLTCKKCHTIKMWPGHDEEDDAPTTLAFNPKWKKRSPNPTPKKPAPKEKPEVLGLEMQEVAELHVMNDRYLSQDDLHRVLPLKGVMLIKSPKGTGKTEFLKSVAEKCGKENRKTLLLGHRVFLLKNIAERTGLDYYRDIEGDLTDGIAVCMNSLTRLNPKTDIPYDTVIIDESEQVLMHLASKTLSKDRAEVFNNLIWVIKRAQRIICLDADLTSELTLQIIKEIRTVEKMVKQQNIGIINEYQFEQRRTTMYESQHHLLSDAIKAVEAGQNIYIATNSKNQANVIGTIFDTIDVSNLVVTADTNDTPDCLAFIENPSVECQQYRVVIASPTAQTGISIDGGHFNAVYGFFGHGIGTYQDVDQALSRVRGCEDTRVWVQIVDHKAEIDSEASIYNKAVETERGTRMIIIGEEESNLSQGELLWARIYARLTWLHACWSHDKAAKFEQLRIETGYAMHAVFKDDMEAAIGKGIYNQAKQLQTGSYLDDLMNAPDPGAEALEDIRKKRVQTHEERVMLDRDRYKKALGARFNRQTVELALKQNLLSGLKRLDHAINFDHDRRIAYDKSSRKKGSLTFTDATHRALQVALLEDLCASAELDFRKLVLQAKEAATTGSDKEVEVSIDQLKRMAAYFAEEKLSFNRYFNSRISDPENEKNIKKVWEATLGEFHLPLTKKRVGKEKVPHYFIDWKKKSLMLELFEEE